jgi:hypothetical protein
MPAGFDWRRMVPQLPERAPMNSPDHFEKMTTADLIFELERTHIAKPPAELLREAAKRLRVGAPIPVDPEEIKKLTGQA